jgi:hypothetical protein
MPDVDSAARTISQFVMPGLAPGIHVLLPSSRRGWPEQVRP